MQHFEQSNKDDRQEAPTFKLAVCVAEVVSHVVELAGEKTT